MGFILKIYLIGLVAFVPSDHGRQMTVLLVDARNGFQASDGSLFPPHYPALLARAAHCKGNCTHEIAKIGPHIYSRTSDPIIPSSLNPAASLRRVTDGGGAWALADSQISFDHVKSARGGSALRVIQGRRSAQEKVAGGLADMPVNSSEKEDFSWVAEMPKIAPSLGEIDPDCLLQQPQKCPVTSRLIVNEGALKTYKLAAFLPKDGSGGIAKFKFEALAGDNPTTTLPQGYTQALADWTAVEIPIAGCEVTFTARSRDGKRQKRTMKLSPAECNGKDVVEVALLNLPDPSHRAAFESHVHDEPKGVGTHFEFFYELSKARGDQRQRPIPQVTGEYLPTAQVGQDKEPSPLLRVLGLSRAGTYSLPICPQAVFAEPQ